MPNLADHSAMAKRKLAPATVRLSRQEVNLSRKTYAKVRCSWLVSVWYLDSAETLAALVDPVETRDLFSHVWEDLQASYDPC